MRNLHVCAATDKTGSQWPITEKLSELFSQYLRSLLSFIQGYMILDTCSQQPDLAVDRNVGALIKSRFDFMDTDFEVLTISGGEYRLCWCAAGFECSGADDFVIDVGTFTVVGIQCFEAGCVADRTCVSGQPCNVDGIQGVHLGPLDTIAILDTCGTATIPHLTGHWNDAPHAVRSVAWNTDYLTVGGGIYKLCWCAGLLECSQSEHFRVEAGSLTVVGPAPKEQHRTCIGGQQCVIEGFVVESPTTTDLAMVLQTCGSVGGSISSTVATLGASGSRVDFGNAFASASGGTYRLCWCSGNFGCQLPSDFRVQLGELTILGMSPLYQDRTCISGQTCAIHGLSGESISDTSHVMVLDSCGTADLVPRLVLEGLAEGVEDEGSTMLWGRTPMTSAGGRYRLCWCGEERSNSSIVSNGVSAHRCNDPLDFTQDIGTLTIIGAAPLTQDFTCTVGRLCSMRSISGEGLAAGDSIMLLNTCGVGNLPERFPFDIESNSTSNQTLTTLRYMTGPYFNIIWQTAVAAAGGYYSLCWCSGAVACSTAEHFRLSFGTLTLAGPSPLLQHHTCTSGRSCHPPALSVVPRDLDVGEVAVLSTCSFQSSWAPNGFPNRGLLLTNTSDRVTAGGGFYTLCWNPTRDAINRTVDADIGEFQTEPVPESTAVLDMHL